MVSVASAVAAGAAWGASKLGSALQSLAQCRLDAGSWRSAASEKAADKPELLSAMHKRMVEIEERCAMLERRQVAAQSSMKQGTRLLQSRVEGLQRRVDTSSSAVAAAGGVLRVPGQPAREPSRGTEPAGAPWTGSQDRVVAFIPTSALREAARAAPSMEDSWVAVTGVPLPQELATPGGAVRATTRADHCRRLLESDLAAEDDGQSPAAASALLQSGIAGAAAVPGAAGRAPVSFLFASPAPTRPQPSSSAREAAAGPAAESVATAAAAPAATAAAAPAMRPRPFAAADLSAAAARLGKRNPKAASGPQGGLLASRGAPHREASGQRAQALPAPQRPRPFGMGDLAAAARKLRPAARASGDGNGNAGAAAGPGGKRRGRAGSGSGSGLPASNDGTTRRGLAFGAGDLLAAAKRLRRGGDASSGADANGKRAGEHRAGGQTGGPRRPAARPGTNPFSAEALLAAKQRLRRPAPVSDRPPPPAGKGPLVSVGALQAAKQRLRRREEGAGSVPASEARRNRAASAARAQAEPATGLTSSAIMREVMASSVLRRAKTVAAAATAKGSAGANAGRGMVDSAWSQTTAGSPEASHAAGPGPRSAARFGVRNPKRGRVPAGGAATNGLPTLASVEESQDDCSPPKRAAFLPSAASLSLGKAGLGGRRAALSPRAAALSPRSPNARRPVGSPGLKPSPAAMSRGMLSPELLRGVHLKPTGGQRSPGGTPKRTAREGRMASGAMDQAEFFKAALKARFGRMHLPSQQASPASHSSFGSDDF